MTVGDRSSLLPAAIAAVRDCADTMETHADSLLRALPELSVDEELRPAVLELSSGLKDTAGRVTFELALLQAQLNEGKATAATAVRRLSSLDATMMGTLATVADVVDQLEKAAERNERNEPAYVLMIEAAGVMLQSLEKAKASTAALRTVPPKRPRPEPAPPPVRVATDGSVVVLEVGAEGGSLTLIGRERTDGMWQFARITIDQSEALFGEVDVPVTAPDLTSLEWVDGWEAGLRLMDRYPWVRLSPQYVHREFVERVQAAVEERLAQAEDHRAEYARENWERVLGRDEQGRGP